MKKFPKISHLEKVNDSVNQPIYELEKMDGSNLRWKLLDTDEILMGSRKSVYKNGDTPMKLSQLGDRFRPTIEYIHKNLHREKLREIEQECGELLFFGESMTDHIVNYNFDGTHPDVKDSFPNYLGFDIWSESDQKWLPHPTVQEIHSKIGLETVPVMEIHTDSSFGELQPKTPVSQYRTPDTFGEVEFNTDGLAEGVVYKTKDSTQRAKYVDDYMSEVKRVGKPDDSESLTDLQYKKQHTDRFIQTFVTETRIKKHIHKLLDTQEYSEISMSMMKELPMNILVDILEEEAYGIISNEYSIDLTEETKKSIRKETEKRCSTLISELKRNQKA